VVAGTLEQIADKLDGMVSEAEVAAARMAEVSQAAGLAFAELQAHLDSGRNDPELVKERMEQIRQAVIQMNEKSPAAVLAAMLARLGLGWVDPRASNDRDSLREDQELAAGERAGIWSEPNPVPPWEWRQKGEKSTGSGPVLLSQRAANL
jgi:hypothetical protein